MIFTGTVYPKKYAHGFCFAGLCCGYTLTDFPISIRLTSLALWQSNDCPSASKATLMNMDKYFMWIHYERLHNHNKAKHNKTVCIFLGIYCIHQTQPQQSPCWLKALCVWDCIKRFCQESGVGIRHVFCSWTVNYAKAITPNMQCHDDTFTLWWLVYDNISYEHIFIFTLPVDDWKNYQKS